MKKRVLIDALKDYPDDTEILIWNWQEDGSHLYLTNPVLGNYPESGVFLLLFERCRAYDVTKMFEERTKRK